MLDMAIRYKSTNGSSTSVTLEEAVLSGLASDGGLFFPTQIPTLSMAPMSALSPRDIIRTVASLWLSDEVAQEEIWHIADDAINFTTPLRELDKQTNLVELFGGPTLAFK